MLGCLYSALSNVARPARIRLLLPLKRTCVQYLYGAAHFKPFKLALLAEASDVWFQTILCSSLAWLRLLLQYGSTLSYDGFVVMAIASNSRFSNVFIWAGRGPVQTPNEGYSRWFDSNPRHTLAAARSPPVQRDRQTEGVSASRHTHHESWLFIRALLRFPCFIRASQT